MSNAVDAFATLLSPVPADAMEWSVRFADLHDRLQTLADIGQTLAQESGDAADAELQAWAEAAKNCVESHARDVQIAIPWLRFAAEDIRKLEERHARNSAEWNCLNACF